MNGLSSRRSCWPQATERVTRQVRERFDLPREASVEISEEVCNTPGCPDAETVVSFWTAQDVHHRFKVFKPVEEIVESDIPFAWMLPTLVNSSVDDECC